MIAKIRVPSKGVHLDRRQDGDGLNAKDVCHHDRQFHLPEDNRVAGVL